jgi:hypothetical protein
LVIFEPILDAAGSNLLGAVAERSGLRIVRRIAVSAFVLAAGLNETPIPPALLFTILGRKE